MRSNLLVVLVLGLTCGCRNIDRRPPPKTPPPPVVIQQGQPQPVVPGPVPIQGNPNPFPGNPPPPPPPGPTGGIPSGPDRVELRWQPVEGRVQLSNPDPILGTGKDVQLYPPEFAEGKEPPTIKTEKRPAGKLPSGIPQFAEAMDKVTTGLRPGLDDGLDWLEANGYKTVLHLRLPAEPDNADRKQVEKRNMKYLALEVAPQNLSKEVVEEFSRIVRDKAGQPLFVYDTDGAVAGTLWYLHFRLTEQLSDDVARVRASALGLREEREGAHRDMWLAGQKLLEEKTPR